MDDRTKRGHQKKDGRQRAINHLYEIGKIPPQAVEMEEAVLGAMMLERDALSQVVDILHTESFYREAHGLIFQAIHDLFHRGDPVDILTVTQELRRTGQLELVGGAYYVSLLTNRVASSANIEYHARIIAQKDIQRRLIRISCDTIREAYEESADVFDLMDAAERSLFSVVETHIRKNYSTMVQLISETMKNMDSARKNKNNVSGVPSGFTALDRITSGWQPSDLIIIAARPAMGKTAFLLSLARNASIDFQKPIAVFSLEMAGVQLVQRLVSAESEIPSDKIKKGTVTDDEMQQVHVKIGKLSEAPIFIDDTPALSIFELRAKTRRLKAQKDIQMIVVDYLQLMTAGNKETSNGFRGNREQEIASISRALKSIAKELNIPVIALSQLSRAVETRGGDKRPQLSDLRESGAIEQDSDMVLFLHRPEYYGMTQDAEGNSTHGLAEVIVAKHRNGATGSVNLRFIDRLAKFMDLEGEYSSASETTQDMPQQKYAATNTPAPENYNPASGLSANNDFLRGSGGTGIHTGDPNDDCPF